MRKTLLALALILTAHLTYAQKGTITGTLVDSANVKTTLNFATISVFKGTDTVLTTYKLSDDKGIFRITNLDLGVKYRLVINAWLYQVLRKEVELTADNPTINLGNILLSEKRNNLNEVVIMAERPPVIVRKDTIEFNAESFKTLPTAVVEDLLKKLPGVTVAADGTIQVNGKPVSRILVDGKEFFGGDQQMATKNLPSNIIDKVSISNDAEATRRDPDLIAGNTPQVINLKLKKAIKKGAFGKLYAGMGLNERFETGGIMNFFRDTTQVSVLAYGNNINKAGFSIGDVSRIGGFSRTGINQVNMNGDSYSLNGIGFGGASTGVQKSAGSGANFNTISKKGLKINGKYFFGFSDNSTDQFTSNDQNLSVGKLITLTNSDKRNKSINHNFGAKVDWKIDSLTSFTFEPTVTLNLLRNLNLDNIDSKNAQQQLLSTGFTNTNFKSNNADYSLLMGLWKDSKKVGRSFNTSVSITRKDNLSDNFNNSLTTIVDPSISTTTIDQLRDNNIRNFGIYLTANYTEPISKKLSLRFILNGNYIDNENALFTFFKNTANAAYDIAIPTLTETVQQSGYKSNGRINLRWKVTKDLTIQPGLVLNIIGLQNKFTSYPSFNQNFQFLAGSLNINYKNYSFSYTPSFREPDVSYIQPVMNNTNNFLKQLGNPDLLPARAHQINLNLYKYDSKRSLSYNLNANGTFQNDAIIMERTIVSGVQTNKPVNADGILQFHNNGSINKDFKNAKRQFTLGGGYYLNFNRNIVSVNNVRSYSYIFQGAPRINARINLNDKFEFGQNYSLGFNKSSYENSFPTISFFNHSADTELILRWPKKMVWETNFRLIHSTQSVNGYNNDQKLWNAGLTLLFMKNDRAQLKFTVNDILGQNYRRYIYITENAVRDFSTNNLGRHALVTLTYNIQNFGGKVGGRDTFFRF